VLTNFRVVLNIFKGASEPMNLDCGRAYLRRSSTLKFRVGLLNIVKVKKIHEPFNSWSSHSQKDPADY
jgi:hypothetical protein